MIPCACRITSKVAGQGQAERDWSFTKDIRNGKRLKFSSRNLMDQVTCYGAYSVERAAARNKEKESLNLTCTDDDYKSLGLGKFLIDLGRVTGETPIQRTFRAFIEDWEEDALVEKTLDNEIMLHRKYGGVKFYDVDSGFVTYTIDQNQLEYSRRKKDPGAYVIAINLETQEEEPWMITDDLHFGIRAYYKHNPDDPHVRVVTEEEFKELGKPPDDEDLLDEWIANDGKFPAKKAIRSKKTSAARSKSTKSAMSVKSGKSAARSTKSSKSATKSKSTEPESDSDSDEDDLHNPPPVKQPHKTAPAGPPIELSESESSDDDGDEDEETVHEGAK